RLVSCCAFVVLALLGRIYRAARKLPSLLEFPTIGFRVRFKGKKRVLDAGLAHRPVYLLCHSARVAAQESEGILPLVKVSRVKVSLTRLLNRELGIPPT